jgi:hypothetical protein
VTEHRVNGLIVGSPEWQAWLKTCTCEAFGHPDEAVHDRSCPVYVDPDTALLQAWDAGWRAFDQRKSRGANPFDPDSAEAREWDDGWVKSASSTAALEAHELGA